MNRCRLYLWICVCGNEDELLCSERDEDFSDTAEELAPDEADLRTPRRLEDVRELPDTCELPSLIIGNARSNDDSSDNFRCSDC